MQDLIRMNCVILEQGIKLLQTMNVEIYTKKASHCYGSTIGGHIRHAVDHYLSFLNGLPNGRIDYAFRERNEGVEQSHEKAVAILKHILLHLKSMGSVASHHALMVADDAGGDWVPSSVGRELQFLLSHSIHHYALVVSIGSLEGVRFEPEFGVAPSTLAYQTSR